MVRKVFVLLVLSAALAFAADATLSGTLEPRGWSWWPVMTAWNGSTYAEPIVGSPEEMAQNIYMNLFEVSPEGSTVTFGSAGYGLGGFVPVLSVFRGGRMFEWEYLTHRYSTDPDFQFKLDLEGGVFYVLTVSMYPNQPCAAGLCPGAGTTFGDGFTNTAAFDASRPNPLYYNVSLKGYEPLPEPSTIVLGALGLSAILAKRSWKDFPRFTQAVRRDRG
jgi:hypothetical protein